jgi:hypothetical protein
VVGGPGDDAAWRRARGDGGHRLLARTGALAPAALVLLRGQVDTSDADPGNRIPDRGEPEGAAWEPLHKALDLWDTATIKKWIAPQGWMTTSGTMAGQTSGGGVQPSGGVNTGGGQTGNGGVNNGSGQPGAQPPPPPAFSWRHPAVLVAGATALTTVGVTLYALRQSRQRPAPAPTMNTLLAPPSPAAATATAAPTNAAPTTGPTPTSAATAAPSAKETT